MDKQTSTHLTALLITVSFVLWVFTILTTTVSEINVESPLGLIQKMPPSFLIGMVSLAIACGSLSIGLASKRLSYIAILLVFLYFWATPSLIEDTTRQQDSYWHASGAMAISASGHIPSSTNFYYSGDWPGIFLFGAIESLVSGLTMATVIRYFPLLTGGMVCFLIYLLSKHLFGDERYAFISTVFCVVGAMYLQLHYSPMGLSTPLAILLIYLGTRQSNSIAFEALTLLSSSALAIFHAITPFWVLAVLVTYLVADWIICDRRRREPTYAVFTVLLVTLAWNAFHHSLTSLGSSLLLDAIRGYRFYYVPQLYVVPIVGYVRRGILAFYVAFGIISSLIGVVELKKKGKREIGQLWAIAVFMGGLVFLAFHFLLKISPEFLPRELMYLTIGSSLTLPITLVAYKNTDIMKVRTSSFLSRAKHCFVIIFMTSLFLLGFLAAYAQEGAVKARQSDVAGTMFIASSINVSYTLYDNFAGMVFFHNPSLVESTLTTKKNVLIHESANTTYEIENESLVIFQYSDYMSTYQSESETINNVTFLTRTMVAWNRIYDSNTFQAYCVEPR